MNDSNAMRNEADLKSDVTVYVDPSNQFYLVDRHADGIFYAQKVGTSEGGFVDALALECCRVATEEEIKLLGINLD